MSHITKINIKNYKSISELSIDFSMGLSVIIGKNGSGKTNFVNAVSDLVKGTIEEENSVLSLEIVYKDTIWQIQAQRKADLNKKNENNNSKYYYTLDNNKVDKGIFESKEEIDAYLQLEYNLSDFINYAITFIHYGIPFNKIETLKITENGNIKVEPDYTIFTKIIQHNWLQKDEKMQAFVKHILLFPSELCEYLNAYSPIQSVRFNQMRVIDYIEHNKKVYDNIQIQFQVNGEWLYWQQLSDGTRRLFYLITEIYLANGIIFIEEPELGIHPHQLHDLMRFIQTQAKTKQIVITTHSPQVINYLSSDDLDKLIVCEMTENGTKIRHLTDRQIKKAQQYMKTQLSLGDYWLHSDLEPSKDDVI